MPDDTFEIGFETTGDAKAVRAFEALKIEQRELQTQSKALSARLRELEAAGETNSTEFKELSRAYVQAREASSQLGRQASQVSRGMRGQAQAARASTAALGGSRKASQNAGRNMGMLVNSVAELGYSFGTAIPGMQRYGTQMAMMGGNAVTFGAALGPVGVAIGVVSGLLPVAIAAFTEFSGSTDNASSSIHHLGNETRNTTEDLQDLVSVLERQQGLRSLQDRVDMGVASSTEMEAFEDQAEHRVDAARARLQAATDAFNAVERRISAAVEAGREVQEGDHDLLHDLLRRRQESQEAFAEAYERRLEVTAAADQANAEEVRAVSQDLADDARERASSRSRASTVEREAERKRADAVREASRHAVDAVAEEYSRREELARAHTQMLLAEDRRRADNFRDRMSQVDRDIQREGQLMDEEEQSRLEKMDETARRHIEEQKALAQITESMWSSVGGSVMDIAGQTTKFLIKGAEGGSDAFLAMLDSFLEATAIEYTIKALGEAANAVAAAARGDGAGAAQHAIAAGLAAGVAAATGLASAAIQTPSAATAGGGASSAQPQAQPQGQGGGTTNVTVQLYAPNAVMTDAERGLFVQQSLRAARREYGPAGER